MRTDESVLDEIGALFYSFKLDVVKVVDQRDVSNSQVGQALLVVYLAALLDISESAMPKDTTPEDTLEFMLASIKKTYELKRTMYKLQKTS